MKVLIFLCFLLSGISGLIFQVVWIRMLGLVFGTSSFAITTVLTSFMTGLALGSLITGRISDNKKYNYLRGYGILEILVGIYGLFTPVIISNLMGWYANIYEQYSPNFYLFSLIRFAVLSLVLIPPTAMMGSTLPLLCKFLTSQKDKDVGLKIGMLYGINTLGAVLGTVISGFILIPNLGVLYTIYAAAIICSTAGIISVILSFKVTHEEFLHETSEAQVVSEGSAAPATAEIPSLNVTDGEFRFMLFAFAVSGGVALSYEIGWSRVLVLILGGAVYSFSTMLATFLLGLALGSMLMAKYLDRVIHRGKEIFYGLQLCIGLSAFATAHMFNELPNWYVSWVYTFKSNFLLFHVMKCGLAGCVMFLPTLFLGMIFPLVARINATRTDIGSSVGDVYFINTLGSIIGSFCMGFIMVPFLGVSVSLMLCVLMNILLACAGSIVLSKHYIQAALIFVVFLVVGSFKPVWDASKMTSGVFRYAPSIAKDNKIKEQEEGYYRSRMELMETQYSLPRIRFYKDGLTAAVSVHQSPSNGELTMKINGKPEASSKGDLPTQTLVGHLPMLFYPSEIDEVLVIGLASGITTASAACYPYKRLTCVELEAATIEGAKLYSEHNRGLIQRGLPDGKVSNFPNFDLKTIDARNYLLGKEKKYSVIISQPSNPWLSGVSNLFTKEFFKLCKDRLKDDGILCQWLQIYEISWENFQILLSTLRSEFPHLMFFRSKVRVDVIILASKQEIPRDWERIQQRMNIPEVKEDLARTNADHPGHIFANFLGSTKETKETFEGTFYNTDDNAYIEFTAPQQLFISSEEAKKILKNVQKNVSCPLKYWIEIVPEDKKEETALAYLKSHLERKEAKFLIEQQEELLGLFEGKLRSEVAGWLGLSAILSENDPTPFFNIMDEDYSDFLRGQVWRLEHELSQAQTKEEKEAVLEKLAEIDHHEAQRVLTLGYYETGNYAQGIVSGEAGYPDRKNWFFDQQIAFLNAYGRCVMKDENPDYKRAITILDESQADYWEEYHKRGVLKFDDTLTDIAKCYFQLGEIELAGSYLIKAVNTRQAQANIYYRKAMEPKEPINDDEKLKILEKVVSLDPTFYQGSITYWEMLKKKDPAKAKEFEKQLDERFEWFKDIHGPKAQKQNQDKKEEGK